MAVVDTTVYKNTTNLPIDAVAVSGADSLSLVIPFTITSGNSATSIFRLAEIPSNFIPVSGEITCAAITTLDDFDLGIYETAENGGGVLDVDALVASGDLSSALAPGAGLSPISAIAIANQAKALYALASDVSSERQAYALGLTMNAAATATGVVVVKLNLVRRQYAAA